MDSNSDKKIKELSDPRLSDHITSSVVDMVNVRRISDELDALKIQNSNFKKAIAQIDCVNGFIGKPERILGSELTKHGEIAEHVEIGIRRAKQAFDGMEMTATFDGINRIAPTDYLIDGSHVQSKFINGANNNLTHVIDHMVKYPNFGRDGSYYHIPKDTYDTLDKIYNQGNADHLNHRSVQQLQEKMLRIEFLSGKKFNEVVKPGLSTYAEVQYGKVDRTLKVHKTHLTKKHKALNEKIKHNHKPNLTEGFKVIGAAAGVGAGVSLVTGLYIKKTEGKRFYRGEFTAEDWKEIGIDSVSDGIKAVASASIMYGLTNYAELSAPLAGAIVSTASGVGSLVIDFKKGDINEEELIELGMVICAEAAVIGCAAAVGQVMIPIPVLGMAIGSIAGTILTKHLGPQNRKTAHKIRQEINDYLKILNEEYRQLVQEITDHFKTLGELTRIAFDPDLNVNLLNSSVVLAKNYGVPDAKLIHSVSELDRYMTT